MRDSERSSEIESNEESDRQSRSSAEDQLSSDPASALSIANYLSRALVNSNGKDEITQANRVEDMSPSLNLLGGIDVATLFSAAKKHGGSISIGAFTDNNSNGKEKTSRSRHW